MVRPDRARRGEGSEIFAFAVPPAAMLQDLRDRMVASDENEGEGFVVAQHYVVAGLQPLDQVGLEQQRVDLRRGGDEFHARRIGYHAGDAVIVASPARITLHPLLQVPRLADIKHLVVGSEHAVNAGARWRRLGVAKDDGRAGFRP